MEEQKVDGKIIVVVESDEKSFPFSDFSTTFDSTPSEILDAVAPAILEKFGINIKEEQGGDLYTVKKVQESGNVYIFPKSPAGSLKNNQQNS